MRVNLFGLPKFKSTLKDHCEGRCLHLLEKKVSWKIVMDYVLPLKAKIISKRKIDSLKQFDFSF